VKGVHRVNAMRTNIFTLLRLEIKKNSEKHVQRKCKECTDRTLKNPKLRRVISGSGKVNKYMRQSSWSKHKCVLLFT
jgi:hypothetical protein